MTKSTPRYDDEEFLHVLDLAEDDHWIGTAPISRIIGCGMETVNRRLIALASETDIEIYDPTVGDGDGEPVDPESFEDGPPRRQLGFRREPEDPESAPNTLESGYYSVTSWILLAPEGSTSCKNDE